MQQACLCPWAIGLRYLFAHAESFNERDCEIIQEATGICYTERNSLCLPFYTDCIIIVRHKVTRHYEPDRR